VHTLVGGGGQHGGFDELDYRKIKHWDACKLGKYAILSVLPDKFARFLYEFHDFLFSSLDLPPLPADRSYFDVHGAIDTPFLFIKYNFFGLVVEHDTSGSVTCVRDFLTLVNSDMKNMETFLFFILLLLGLL
jgi:hypothetical protein